MSAPAFFGSKAFAVVGASADTSKFGNKLLRWYLERGLTVVPVNPRGGRIEDRECVVSVAELDADYSVSVVTPPAVALQVLAQARTAGVKHVWLQPGSEDDAVVALVREWRDADPKANVLLGGPCVLADGDQAIAARTASSNL
ncbi:hypothetical protein HK100_006125 [Physocladia obscura]|uniref:CoA-binding domain-containing protein n=1 Tax=Physocladia obscura TaxID=109957 RepID=A0AAD5XIN6_9FUNG|nr:hypothetical protein HK100_006125 [Physocladia obscura]